MVEKDKRNPADTLVVTELPYQVQQGSADRKDRRAGRDKAIEGIKYVPRRNPTGRGCASRSAQERGRGCGDHQSALQKHPHGDHFRRQFLAIVNNRPELLNLKAVLGYFVLHRKEIVIRRTRFDLAKAEARAHILEGLKVALDHLDEVVALIRNSASRPRRASG